MGRTNLRAELLFLDHTPTPVIEQPRRILVRGEAQQWGTCPIQFRAEFLAAWLGLLWFLKMHGILAGVL